MSFLFFFNLVLLSVVSGKRNDYPKNALHSQITSLPGLAPSVLAKYTMFSGYVDVYPASNRSLFYWLVESLKDSKNDPLVLWTNGGPGCSGLGGFFTEQGPFRPNKDLTLKTNEFSWVNQANMLFIEAPAGVGFSFSNNKQDYKTNDTKTAVDNYNLIRGFLDQFPNFQSNAFFIASESYGGHYMPTLARQIVEGNKAGLQPKINFKGFFVGNPYTNPVENAKGMFDTWYGHQLVSFPTFMKWSKDCAQGTQSGPLCHEAQHLMNDEVSSLIDPYALDFPICLPGVQDEKVWLVRSLHKALRRPVPASYRKHVDFLNHLFSKRDKDPSYTVEMFHTSWRDWKRKNGVLHGRKNGGGYDPCAEAEATSYLNQASVQRAIHAKPTEWALCSSVVDYSDESMNTPMQPVYKWLIENAPELRITIVSGDDDSVCGTLGTQSWIWNMGYEASPQWTHWKTKDGQLGGYVVKFKNAFNMVTVHGAGHMIPQTQPEKSLQTFKMYLESIFLD